MSRQSPRMPRVPFLRSPHHLYHLGWLVCLLAAGACASRGSAGPEAAGAAPAQVPAEGKATAAPSPAPATDVAPSNSRTRVLRRVDEQGVSHYVIEPSLDPQSAVPEVRDEPAAYTARAERRVSPQATADYSALADVQGTAATIRELEIQIERDREALKQIISETRPAGVNAGEDPRLREIAERLPRLQAELEALLSESRP